MLHKNDKMAAIFIFVFTMAVFSVGYYIGRSVERQNAQISIDEIAIKFNEKYKNDIDYSDNFDYIFANDK